jgi:hypothetical protein
MPLSGPAWSITSASSAGASADRRSLGRGAGRSRRHRTTPRATSRADRGQSVAGAVEEREGAAGDKGDAGGQADEEAGERETRRQEPQHQRVQPTAEQNLAQPGRGLADPAQRRDGHRAAVPSPRPASSPIMCADIAEAKLVANVMISAKSTSVLERRHAPFSARPSWPAAATWDAAGVTSLGRVR